MQHNNGAIEEQASTSERTVNHTENPCVPSSILGLGTKTARLRPGCCVFITATPARPNTLYRSYAVCFVEPSVSSKRDFSYSSGFSC